MLTYVRTSLFDSPAQTLVNTVNVVGVMGKGIALEFKKRYPLMFKAYKELCQTHTLDIGKLHLWRAEDHWILNFPTKTTWKKPSKIEFISAGLDVFVRSYKEMGITSIAFPPLGCGNGNLDWSEVRPLMENYLSKLEIPVYIHDRQVKAGFVPEHSKADVESIPLSYEDFLHDLRELMLLRGGSFETLKGTSNFSATWHQDGGITISRAGRTDSIPNEIMEWAWSALQSGILTADQFPSEGERKLKSYFFPILAELPYVEVAEISKPGWSATTPAHGLFISRKSRALNSTQVSIGNNTNGEQGCLSL